MAVQANAVTRKDDVSSREVALMLRTNSTDYVGDAQECLSDYRNVRQIWKQNPDTSGIWSLTQVNNTQFGQKLVG